MTQQNVSGFACTDIRNPHLMDLIGKFIMAEGLFYKGIRDQRRQDASDAWWAAYDVLCEMDQMAGFAGGVADLTEMLSNTLKALAEINR